MYGQCMDQLPASRSVEISSVTGIMESYLATSTYTEALQAAYEAARHGGGGNDRNIADAVLIATVVGVQAALPEPLSEIPPANAEFIDTAVASVLPEVAQGGVKDLAELDMAVQVVLLQLAGATDKLMASLGT